MLHFRIINTTNKNILKEKITIITESLHDYDVNQMPQGKSFQVYYKISNKFSSSWWKITYRWMYSIVGCLRPGIWQDLKKNILTGIPIDWSYISYRILISQKQKDKEQVGNYKF